MQHSQSYLVKSVVVVGLLITAAWIPIRHFRPLEQQSTLTQAEASDRRTYSTPAYYSSTVRKDDIELRKVLDVLRTTRFGVMAIRQLRELGVGVRFEVGKGSFFEPERNQIVIDASYDPIRASLALMHELTHASYNIQSLNANILVDDRQAYIDKQINEEVTSIINGIELKWELADIGFDVSHIHYPLEFLYRQSGDKETVTDLIQDQNKPFRKFGFPGDETGRERLLVGFYEGKTWIPTTGETYPEYYGRYWDSSHTTS